MGIMLLSILLHRAKYVLAVLHVLLLVVLHVDFPKHGPSFESKIKCNSSLSSTYAVVQTRQWKTTNESGWDVSCPPLIQSCSCIRKCHLPRGGWFHRLPSPYSIYHLVISAMLWGLHLRNKWRTSFSDLAITL